MNKNLFERWIEYQFRYLRLFIGRKNNILNILIYYRQRCFFFGSNPLIYWNHYIIIHSLDIFSKRVFPHNVNFWNILMIPSFCLSVGIFGSKFSFRCICIGIRTRLFYDLLLSNSYIRIVNDHYDLNNMVSTENETCTLKHFIHFNSEYFRFLLNIVTILNHMYLDFTIWNG